MTNHSLGTRIAVLYELQARWLEPVLKQAGINWSGFQLLTAVQAIGGQPSQADIAKSLGITPATLSESVFVYVKRGLLEQVSSSTDRRVKELKLTTDGKKLLTSIAKRMDEFEVLVANSVSDSQLELVTKNLDKLINKLETRLD